MNDSADRDASWIDELFQWADENNIPELQYIEGHEVNEDGEGQFEEGFWIGLPRDKNTLLTLGELDLSWHGCTEMPIQLRHLKQLKVLRFAKSRDGTQPHFYENSENLRFIEVIPDWIAELENLEELDLSGNRIRVVPNAVGKLTKLKELYINDNDVEHVETEVVGLTNLEVLWFRGNLYRFRTESLKKLKNLKELWLDGFPGSAYGPIELKSDHVVIRTGRGPSAIAFELHKPRNMVELLEYLEAVTKQPWIDELYEWADRYGIPGTKFVSDNTFDHNGSPRFAPYYSGLPRDRYELLGLEELNISLHSYGLIPEQLGYLKSLKMLCISRG